MEWVQTVRRGAMAPLPYSDEKGRGVQEKTVERERSVSLPDG